MKVIKFSIFLFIICSTALLAQNSVWLNDTTVDRERYSDIPLYGTITGADLTDLTIELVYDSRIIDIKSASGGTGYAMQAETPVFTTDFTRIDSARVTIKSNDVVAVNNGIICNLQVKGLVFSDSLAYVTPLRVLINGQEVTANLKSGIIKVLGPPVFPNFPDHLSYGYPNPFNYQVRFDFSLKQESAVQFIVYTMSGVRVLDSENSQGMLKVYSSKNNIPVEDLTNLQEGSYYVIFTPLPMEIASQYFVFVMKTDRQVFNTNIIYCK
jgi:hypothetical protein